MRNISISRICNKRNIRINEDVDNRNKAGWIRWKMTSVVICNKRIPSRLKAKCYEMIVRPIMLYDRILDNYVSIHTICRSQRYMYVKMECDRTRNDKIRIERIRGYLEVADIVDKIREMTSMVCLCYEGIMHVSGKKISRYALRVKTERRTLEKLD